MADTLIAPGAPLKITEGGDFAWFQYMHRSKLSPLETANFGPIFQFLWRQEIGRNETGSDLGSCSGHRDRVTANGTAN